MSETFDIEACRRDITAWRNEGLRVAMTLIAEPSTTLQHMRAATTHHEALLGILNRHGLLLVPAGEALDCPQPTEANVAEIYNELNPNHPAAGVPLVEGRGPAAAAMPGELLNPPRCEMVAIGWQCIFPMCTCGG